MYLVPSTSTFPNTFSWHSRLTRTFHFWGKNDSISYMHPCPQSILSICFLTTSFFFVSLGQAWSLLLWRRPLLDRTMLGTQVLKTRFKSKCQWIHFLLVIEILKLDVARYWPSFPRWCLTSSMDITPTETASGPQDSLYVQSMTLNTFLLPPVWSHPDSNFKYDILSHLLMSTSNNAEPLKQGDKGQSVAVAYLSQ